MTTSRAVLSILFALAYGFIAIAMPILVVVANRSHVRWNVDRNVSGLPIVGSILGLFALGTAPIGTLGERMAWCWVPLVLEVFVVGCCVAYWNLSGLRRQAEGLLRSRRR